MRSCARRRRSMTQEPPLELTFLGSGNAFVGDRYWSSFILNRRYLFDAPPTLLPHLHKLGSRRWTSPRCSSATSTPTTSSACRSSSWTTSTSAPRTEDLAIVGPPGSQQRRGRHMAARVSGPDARQAALPAHSTSSGGKARRARPAVCPFEPSASSSRAPLAGMPGLQGRSWADAFSATRATR